MGKIAYFDYCAFMVFALVMVATVMRKMTRGKLNRYFMCMIVLCLVTTVADICAVSFDNLGTGHIVGKHIAHTLYLYLHSLLTPVYIIYIALQTDTAHKFKKNHVEQVIFALPTLIVTVLMIVNCFHPIVYYLDENEMYTRGDAFFVLYAVAAFYIIYGIAYLYKYRNTLSKRRAKALFALFPLIMTAVVLQMIFSKHVIEMFANAIGILFIAMLIQRPEERMDPETGLLKLSAYVDDMKRAFMNEKPMQIIMLNVVNYKSLQDMLGYDATVDVKKIIAEKMISLDRRRGLGAELYYISDGKFRFVVEEPHFNMVEKVAQEMNSFIGKDLALNQMDLNLVSCICITKCPEDIDDMDALLAFGEDLNAKHCNGEVLYASNLYTKTYYDLRRDIDPIIEAALANHKFEVYYQPIYFVKEGCFRSAEALLRLKDEKYGFIPPDVFIAAAEKSGAIHRIGEFVLEEVCKFIASDSFKQLGLDYIEINLSVVQCMQSNMAQKILEMVEKYHIRPDQINLEITETAASYSQKTMMDNLLQLNDAGVHFSLDDYGTGYSNMKRIASLPLYLVKLDKSFTDVEDNPRLQIVLENTIRMIKAMNLQIVVEGVETENLVKQFSDLECEYIQGYYYSKPVPQDEFVKFMELNRA